MKKGWEVKPLGELFEVTSSKRVLKKDWKSKGIPFYRTREIKKLALNGAVQNELFISEEKYQEYKAKYGVPSPDDLMVTAIGTLGLCYLVKSEDRFYFKDASVLWLKKKSDVFSRYIEYAFQTNDVIEQVHGGEGATVGTYTISRAKQTMLPLPPLEEQKRIVAVLDEAFEGLARARANAEANLRNASDLLESYLDEIFSNGSSEWTEYRLGDICSKIGSGATPRGGKDSYKTEGISLIRSLNVYDRRFQSEGLAFIDDAQAEKLNNVTVEEDDVLLNITGASVARCCVVPVECLPARVNQHVAIIRVDKTAFIPSFVSALLTSKPYKEKLLGIGEAAGATRQAITKAQIQDFRFFAPKYEAQQALVQRLESIANINANVAASYNQKLTDFAELKQSLLQEAFAGELT
ncbi:restriction endonuclease subunit S [Hyphococcus sp.]|uniref:restriction endonuclease subunit S n=1 Tax=Hyphococcus sp. TaxID=2038636 RepID=UPI0035C746EF